ncbi:MAG: hypothetical protein RIQ81_2700 [Pseudomonadota bacterium]
MKKLATKIATCLFMLSACGRVERDPHFDDQKDYGRPIQTGTNPGDVGSDAPLDNRHADPAPVVIPPEADPDKVVASVLFKGRVDPDSFRLLTASGTVLNPWNLPGSSWLRSNFDGEQRIALYGRQTYGSEETGVSKLIQSGISGSADLGVLAGGESESGTQILERVIGKDNEKGTCPTAMVCIRSMVWKPNQGQTRTYCYKDADTGQPKLFPYAPAPNFPLKDALRAADSYGPYTVESHAGEIDCQTVDSKPVESQQVFVRFHVNPNPEMVHVTQKRNKIFPDYSVRVIVDKLGLPAPQINSQPYVDASTKLQAESEYFISSKNKMLVKVVKRARKSILFPGDDETWIGSVVRLFGKVTPITGIMMDIHAEFCMDLLSGNFDNICREESGDPQP